MHLCFPVYKIMFADLFTNCNQYRVYQKLFRMKKPQYKQKVSTRNHRQQATYSVIIRLYH